MEKHFYTVVGYCPDEVVEIFNSIKRNIGLAVHEYKLGNGNIILKDRPHFALKRTFILKNGVTEKDTLTSLEGFDGNQFLVKLGRPDVFRDTPYGNVLYVPIDMNDELRGDHQRLVKLLEPLVETKNPEHELDEYKAHVTFQYNIPEELISKSVEIIKNRIEGMSFWCQKVYLLRDVANGDIDEREELKEINFKCN